MKNSLIISLFFVFYGTFSSNLLLAQETNLNSDLQKATDAYQAGQYSKALQHAKDAINEDPNSWQAYELEGNCYYRLGNSSEMQNAFKESLKLHPDNPTLTTYVGQLPSPPVESSPVQNNNSLTTTFSNLSTETNSNPITQPTPTMNTSINGSLQEFDFMIPKESLNLHLYTGLDVAFMDDLMNGLQNWTNSRKSLSNVIDATDNFSRLGFLSGGELKKTFGNHEFAINAEIITGAGGESDIDSSNGTVGKVNLGPTVWDFSLNYTFHFSPGGAARPYVSLGFGRYSADISYSNPYPTAPGSSISSYFAQGDFTANTWGETLGLGTEITISRSLTFDIGGRLRLATFDQLVSTNLNGSEAPSGTGPYALEIYNNNLYFTTQSSLNSSLNTGHRYAVLDYSGVDLTIGLHFYFGGDPLPAGYHPDNTVTTHTENSNSGENWGAHRFPATNPTSTAHNSGYVPSLGPGENHY